MVTTRPAERADLPELVDLAARTFPLACPPEASEQAIADHIATHLSTTQFEAWLASADHRVVVSVAQNGRLVGYALVVRGVPDDPAVAAAAGPRTRLELSKIYVDAPVQGSGVAGELMSAALVAAGELDPTSPICLGTNGRNQRAQAFYRKHGFTAAGTRTYVVGGETHDDIVMLRPADAG